MGSNKITITHMDEMIIKEKIIIAIETLFSNDSWLLVKNINERSITHKLAEYMQPLFQNYNIDCEYNGDIFSKTAQKRISFLIDELKQKGIKLTKKEVIKTDSEFTDRFVFPDIIIHKRGKSDNNLCIIEVKKTTSNVPPEYDKIKLQAYTSDRYGNDLKYKIGVFIEFKSGTNDLGCKIKYFTNGIETNCCTIQ